MTCGNKKCEFYSKNSEGNCTETHCYKTDFKVQGKKNHVFFSPDLCSLFISEEQYEVV